MHTHQLQGKISGATLHRKSEHPISLGIPPRPRCRFPHAPIRPISFKDRNANASIKVTPTTTPSKDEVDHVHLVTLELHQKDRVLIAQIAPAVRVSIGEEFGLPPGTLCTGKLVAALKLLGFDYVFDVVSAADVTIMEEGTELIHRLRDTMKGKPDAAPLPMFTSCCPGWVEWIEKCAPDLIPYLSSAMSPHIMGGSLTKAFFTEVIGKKDTDICMVSVMPCVRKQGESDRIFYQNENMARHVDHVLTTRDVASMLKERGIDFASLPDAHFDDFLGISSGSGTIFGTTGGVAEAALRTVVEVAGGAPLEKIVFHNIRGLDGIKEADVTIPTNPEGPLYNTEPVVLRVAVANGLGNAKKLMKDVEAGTSPYHFIEVMACPGGCIGGGGQPRSKDKDALKQRQAGLYSADERAVTRRSHENPVVKAIYSRWLGEPGSERAEELLHTQYVECGAPKFDITKERVDSACNLPEDEVCEPEVCEASDSD